MITAETLPDWANMIEGREDMGRGKDAEAICRLIYEAANPALEGQITDSIRIQGSATKRAGKFGSCRSRLVRWKV